jgi:hypothetical protein
MRVYAENFLQQHQPARRIHIACLKRLELMAIGSDQFQHRHILSQTQA